MNNELNKCVILRAMMTILDIAVVDGTTSETCKRVAKRLGNYCADGTSFDPPSVDDFFTVDSIQHRVINAVMMDLNENDVVPFSTSIPVGMGTLLFALHEYQHRYHEDDDPLLVDGLSTLESRARSCIKDAISNDGWGFVQVAMDRAYQSAVVGRQREMVYRLVEVRQALQDWLPAGYDKIFIAGE